MSLNNNQFYTYTSYYPTNFVDHSPSSEANISPAKITKSNSKLFCQQMHSLLKHKMLQLTLKISLYMAATCFGPFEPSSGSIRRNLAKVTVFV
jgi:hypothetical protein